MPVDTEVIRMMDAIKASIDAIPRPLFAIWAEETSDLSNATGSGYQWSYGNGNLTGSLVGIEVPVDCELVRLGLSVEGVSDNTVIALRAGVDQTAYSVSTSGVRRGRTDFATPLFYAKDTLFNFKTTSAAQTASNGGIAVAWFRER